MRSRRGAAQTLWILAAVAFGVVLLAVLYNTTLADSDEQVVLEEFEVETRGFEHTIVEHGEIEASSSVDIICRVKSEGRGGVPILWVVEEGAKVKKGDRVVSLDAAALNDSLVTQRVAVNRAVADKIKAKSALDQAVITKSEYLDGLFVQEQKQFNSEILVAEETLSRAQDTASYSKRLFDLGFLTKQDFETDEFAVKEAEVQLQIAKDKLTTLKDITKRRMLVGYNADIESARADLESKTGILAEEEGKLDDIKKQIGHCEIVAPVDGLVVYANVTSSRGGSEFIVEPGATVRERQTIIRLPDPSSMQVKAKVNEGKVTKLHTGMPVAISVGSTKSMFNGRVKKVNKYAEPSSFFSSQVKEYVSLIEIPNPPPTLRTGMTAEVKIFVEQLEDATVVPIEAIMEHRGHIFVLKKDGKSFETKEVELIGTNDEFAAIASGITTGDTVILNPRTHLNLMDIPEDLEDLTTRIIGSTASK